MQDSENCELVFGVFRPVLKDRITASKIATKVGILKGIREEILKQERKLPRPDVVESLLQKLRHLKESATANWFDSFVSGLEKCGFLEVAHILKKVEDIQDRSVYYSLMRDCYDDLVDVGNPTNILNQLQNVGVISDKDVSDVSNVGEEEDISSAMSLLLCRIPFTKPFWFDELEKAFQSDDQSTAVHIMQRVKNAPNNLSGTPLNEMYTDDTAVKEICPSDGNDSEAQIVPTNNDGESPVKQVKHCENEPCDQSCTCGACYELQSIESNDKFPEDIDSRVDETPALMKESSEQERVKLRSYQEELVEQSEGHHNVVIVAPTGCGKTIVAAEIIKRHFEMKRDSKVAFLVPTVALVKQQSDALSDYLAPLKLDIKQISGDVAGKMPIMKILKRGCDIIVMTPQILFNACDFEDFSAFGFGLVTLDECHHAMKEHPYSKIMGLYHDCKLAKKPLPKIVGLTASVGVGKACKVQEAINYIMQLLANMDAQLVTVTRNRDVLKRFVNRPEEDTVYLEERKDDPLRTSVVQIMDEIEEFMRAKREHIQKAQAEAGQVNFKCNPPTDKGSQVYIQWLSSFETNILVHIGDEDMRRDLVACTEYLRMLNDTLLVNSDCRTCDALKFLDTNFKPQLAFKDRPIEIQLAKMIEDEIKHLEVFSKDPKCKNPKLEVLKEHILKKKKSYDEGMRCIVFAKTRQVCASLKDWANETDELRDLGAEYLTGSNSCAEKKGLTNNQQDEVIKSFASGNHQLIFATTVAEEGLDIQACDNVIRYLFVTSMTARIQGRGRARKENASFALLAGAKEAKQDEMNSIREELQEEAIDAIIKMSAVERCMRIDEEQKKLYHLRRVQQKKEKKLKKEREQLRDQGLDFILQCRRCSEIATASDDIRLIENSHHVVRSRQDFFEKVDIHPNPREMQYAPGWIQTARLHCLCGQLWGYKCIYLEVEYPVIKIDSFEVQYPTGGKKVVKKWKDCPFYIEKLKPDLDSDDEDE